MIRAGRVTVDGVPAHIGQQVDPDSVLVAVDGDAIPIAPGKVYYLLYKPPGVVSSAADTHERPIVTDLVPSDVRVHPVGRLDLDSEGLMLLTNDGYLTQRISHPSFGITKTYVLRTTGSLGKSELAKLVTGVELEDGPARAVSARILDRSKHATMLEVVMTEGRNREVRRMADAIGIPVTTLTRVAIGPLRDRTLKAGQWRELTAEEVRSLYAAGQDPANDRFKRQDGST